MNKISRHLTSYIKQLDGNLLGVGIQSEKILELIQKNNNIKQCDLLESVSLPSNGKKKRRKKVSIVKLRKAFKKKQFDYIVVNINVIEKYLKTFIKDSIYIAKNKVYFYMNQPYDYDNIQKIYQRYNATGRIEHCSDGDILLVDIGQSIDHPIKNKLYYIMDTICEIIEKIGDYLIQ